MYHQVPCVCLYNKNLIPNNNSEIDCAKNIGWNAAKNILLYCDTKTYLYEETINAYNLEKNI